MSIIFSQAWSQENITYDISFLGNTSSGRFAPYFIGSLNHGRIVQKNNALVEIGLAKEIDMSKRFSWGFGFAALAGASSKNTYSWWDANLANSPELSSYPGIGWRTRREGPPAIWLQELYSQIKYRSVFLTVGLREYESVWLNQRLSSGDFTHSGNARPIPQVRVGFLDFVDIPFTKGWVQINGELAYGKMTQNDYLKHHYNYYNYHITLGELYTYKYCHFRTNPEKPFSVTVGMQTAGTFGGTTYYYYKGMVTRIDEHKKGLKAYWNMFFPSENNGDDYYEGSSLGSWDLRLRYRLRNSDEIILYFQGPWEDGSSIGRSNGSDGIWGVEFKKCGKHLITGAVAEFIDFRDQSGPIHWNPDDAPGTNIMSQATGRDNYYNNGYYNSYAAYGMSLGTPFLLSPIYNLDGNISFLCNRASGFQLAMEGYVHSAWQYRLKYQYQRGLGTYNNPYYKAKTNQSFMAEMEWDAATVTPGLSVTACFALDWGQLRGRNQGAMVCVRYNGNFLKLKR